MRALKLRSYVKLQKGVKAHPSPPQKKGVKQKGVQDGLGVQGLFRKYFAAINTLKVTPDIRAEDVRIRSCELAVTVDRFWS